MSCTGNCNQGRACTCWHPDLSRITLTELDLEEGPSATRVISPPQSPPDPQRTKRLTRALATAALALIAFGVLMLCCAEKADQPEPITQPRNP